MSHRELLSLSVVIKILLLLELEMADEKLELKLGNLVRVSAPHKLKICQVKVERRRLD